MKIETPSDEKFRIHRRWLPARLRSTKALDWLPSGGGGSSLGDDPVSGVIAMIVLVPVLLVLAFFVGEVLLLLLLLPFFVLARSVFGTPWVIEVTHRRELVHVEEVRGWGESRARIERLATSMRQGDLPPGVLKRVKAIAKEKAPKKPGAQVKPKAAAKPKTAAKPETAAARPGVQDTPQAHPGDPDSGPGVGTQDTPQDTLS